MEELKGGTAVSEAGRGLEGEDVLRLFGLGDTRVVVGVVDIPDHLDRDSFFLKS